MGLASLHPLRRRDFALLWSAALVSNVGTWMQTVAVGVLVTARTHQAGWTGLVAAAAFVPIGLLSPVGGAMADRFDRRRWLLVTTAGETAFATGLATLAATGQAGPGIVTLLVFGGGIMAAVGFPAYQAMLPDLVDRRAVGGHLAVVRPIQPRSSDRAGPGRSGHRRRLLRPGLCPQRGVLPGRVDRPASSTPPAPSPGGRVAWPAPAVGRGGKGGRRRARMPGRHHPDRGGGPAGLAVHSPGPGSGARAVPRTGQRDLRPGDCQQGLGAVVGALALASLVARCGRRGVVVAVLVTLPVVLVGYAAAPTLDLAAVAILAVGAVYIGVLSGLNSAIQLRAPASARGRVLGLYMMALGTIYPLGALVQGVLGDHLGLRRVTAGTAVLLLVAVAVFVRRRPDLVEALDDPTPVGALPIPTPASPISDPGISSPTNPAADSSVTQGRPGEGRQ